MAKQPVNSGEAESTVFDNLGLDPSELGTDEFNDSDGDDSPELDDGPDDSGDESVDEPVDGPVVEDEHDELAELVTHTSREGKEKVVVKGTKIDSRGNVVDAKGKVIARAGAERNHYDRANRALAQVNEASRQRDDLAQKLERAVELGTQAFNQLKGIQEQETTSKQLGLSPQEAVEAVQFYAEFKRDAASASKKLLTRLAANGMDMTQLGLSGGGFDPKSLLDLVRSEIDRGIQPLREKTQQEQQQAEQERAQQQRLTQTTQEVESYFRDNPQMVPHLPVFQRVMQQFPQMTLGEVGARIELARLRKERSPTPPNPQRRNFPSGRAAPAGNGRGGDLANPNDSYDEILRGVLAEHGM